MVILNTKRISDYVLTIKEDEINVESNVIEQRDKADYEMIKTTRFELVSVHKELNVTIASRDNEKTMKNLTMTLNLPEKLQEEFKRMTDGKPGELCFNLGTNHLHLMIKRIVSKAYRKTRD